jgi:transcriptional regulator with XRE-family HTH domain
MPIPGNKSVQLKTLGANIRRERTARDLTQEQLAEKAGLSLRNMQRIEAGELNPLATTLMRLHQALGCGAEKLLPGHSADPALAFPAIWKAAQIREARARRPASSLQKTNPAQKGSTYELSTS